MNRYDGIYIFFVCVRSKFLHLLPIFLLISFAYALNVHMYIQIYIFLIIFIFIFIAFHTGESTNYIYMYVMHDVADGEIQMT